MKLRAKRAGLHSCAIITSFPNGPEAPNRPCEVNRLRAGILGGSLNGAKAACAVATLTPRSRLIARQDCERRGTPGRFGLYLEVMLRTLVAVLFLLASSSAVAQPLADHHQHLFSPALAALISPAPPAAPDRADCAERPDRLLDAAGIKRAAVLSTAYIWEQPTRNVDNASEKLRADNDWTSQQVAQYPDRLIGFCGLNPLKDYALDELARCAKNPNFDTG